MKKNLNVDVPMVQGQYYVPACIPNLILNVVISIPILNYSPVWVHNINYINIYIFIL